MLEELQTKQICMSPRLVLYGVELEPASGTTQPHSTEEKQDHDYAERSKAEVCCRTEFE